MSKNGMNAAVSTQDSQNEQFKPEILHVTDDYQKRSKKLTMKHGTALLSQTGEEYNEKENKGLSYRNGNAAMLKSNGSQNRLSGFQNSALVSQASKKSLNVKSNHHIEQLVQRGLKRRETLDN